jgi:hypothetical protein
MPSITRLEAPDISDLRPTLLSQTSIGLVYRGLTLPESSSASRFLTAYLMIVDKAIREYSAGREKLITYVESSNNIENLERFADGLGRFENCIHSAKRAFRFMDRMKRNAEIPTIDRTLRKLIESKEQELTSIRNVVEHIDEEIDRLTQGMAHMLVINQNGEYLEIADQRLPFFTLAQALRNLYQLGCEFLAGLAP